MYYELGLIISVANRSGITLDLPEDFGEEVNGEILKDYLQSQQFVLKCNPHIA